MSKPICDFCSATPVAWDYPCREFSVEDPKAGTFVSKESWLACNTCHGMIRSSLRGELAYYSALRLTRRHPEVSMVEAMEAIRLLQDEFWANREGQPTQTDMDGGPL